MKKWSNRSETQKGFFILEITNGKGVASFNLFFLRQRIFRQTTRSASVAFFGACRAHLVEWQLAMQQHPKSLLRQVGSEQNNKSRLEVDRSVATAIQSKSDFNMPNFIGYFQDKNHAIRICGWDPTQSIVKDFLCIIHM